jgi:hypothetical protein
MTYRLSPRVGGSTMGQHRHINSHRRTRRKTMKNPYENKLDNALCWVVIVAALVILAIWEVAA